jgi:acetone carboxylase gamma subunit
MTDEQINWAITEAIGADPHWKCAKDYCNDLNAMNEAEKSLKGYKQIHTYVWHLNNRKDWETDFKLMEVHISARDRAEAFLSTLGKWEEVQE